MMKITIVMEMTRTRLWKFVVPIHANILLKHVKTIWILFPLFFHRVLSNGFVCCAWRDLRMARPMQNNIPGGFRLLISEEGSIKTAASPSRPIFSIARTSFFPFLFGIFFEHTLLIYRRLVIDGVRLLVAFGAPVRRLATVFWDANKNFRADT